MQSHPYKLALLASGEGTNAEAIIKYFSHHLQVKVVLVLSNNPQAGVLSKAGQYNIPVRVFDKRQFAETPEISEWLKAAGVTHIVLAGFLWLIPQTILKTFPGRIINIHPALLPKFGGKGMYGKKVHEAVKASGDHETGITIHLVNEHFDEGKILFQKKCEVTLSDSVHQIEQKVRLLEHEYFPKVIEQWVKGEPIS
ncbi:MAG TPA: phosphoribosylglycinamide formyltransferase [Cyclobacteriaceae bacterium]|nr:phosphoribosylglycinamide formyltransferase [Cyclobacteriaceae bacterium]